MTKPPKSVKPPVPQACCKRWRWSQSALELIPALVDQNLWAQSRSPMDMILHGWSTSLFHASQQWSTISS